MTHVEDYNCLQHQVVIHEQSAQSISLSFGTVIEHPFQILVRRPVYLVGFFQHNIHILDSCHTVCPRINRIYNCAPCTGCHFTVTVIYVVADSIVCSYIVKRPAVGRYAGISVKEYSQGKISLFIHNVPITIVLNGRFKHILTSGECHRCHR